MSRKRPNVNRDLLDTTKRKVRTRPLGPGLLDIDLRRGPRIRRRVRVARFAPGASTIGITSKSGKRAPNGYPIRTTFDSFAPRGLHMIRGSNIINLHGEEIELPLADNTPEALQIYRAANERFRQIAWPKPFDRTTHTLSLGDARDLSALRDSSVHLVVTSPPYWTLKDYPGAIGQLGAVSDYEAFLGELDKVWAECMRVLVPGGRICCVVGDVCVPRRKIGRHLVMPLHADIQVRARALGLDVLTPILWHKVANGVTEAQGNGAGFYGKPYQPGSIVKNDIEYILFLRKGGEYRQIAPLQKVLSMLTRQEMQTGLRSIWTDIKGASLRNGHPAPYPSLLADRLIRLFSFAGDTVLDPFGGTGSTAVASIGAGRNSVSIEIEPAYISVAEKNIRGALDSPRIKGAIAASLVLEKRKSRRNGAKLELQIARNVS
jgi:modification methylase